LGGGLRSPVLENEGSRALLERTAYLTSFEDDTPSFAFDSERRTFAPLGEPVPSERIELQLERHVAWDESFDCAAGGVESRIGRRSAFGLAESPSYV
jgi:hypothetical protein